MVAFTAAEASDMLAPAGGNALARLLSLPMPVHQPQAFHAVSGPVRIEAFSTASPFRYDGDGDPVSGVITRLTVAVQSELNYTLSGLGVGIGALRQDASLLTLPRLLSHADLVTGSRWADRLAGFAGDDRIIGGLGADTIIGGGGTDRLTGGNADGPGGPDVFVFTRPADSLPGPVRDVITDFQVGTGDRIDLRQIDADTRFNHAGNQEFVYIGGSDFYSYHQAFPGTVGMIRYDPATHMLQGNVNGDLAPDFAIHLLGVESLPGWVLLL